MTAHTASIQTKNYGDGGDVVCTVWGRKPYKFRMVRSNGMMYPVMSREDFYGLIEEMKNGLCVNNVVLDRDQHGTECLTLNNEDGTPLVTIFPDPTWSVLNG
jgi:hypothetical protein